MEEKADDQTANIWSLCCEYVYVRDTPAKTHSPVKDKT